MTAKLISPSARIRLDLSSEKQALAYAKKGILLALLSGLIFSTDGLLIKNASGHAPFSDRSLWTMIPLVCAAIHDVSAACIVTMLNLRSGRRKEIWRSLMSGPGRSVIMGALIGSFFGMGGYMAALQLAGPAYVLPITTLYPAVAAILAVFVLKERIPARAWVGLALCVSGAGMIGYAPPDGQPGDLFYLGLLFAALAAIGWGAEGVYATLGMDFIEPIVALNIYYIVSSALYALVLIPLVSLVFFSAEGGLAVPLSFLSSPGFFFVALAGCMGAFSYLCWYSSMSMIGVSRSMAFNISYALWGIVLSFFFTETHITATLVAGALIIFSGMFLVIGNPKEMLNLRNV